MGMNANALMMVSLNHKLTLVLLTKRVCHERWLSSPWPACQLTLNSFHVRSSKMIFYGQKGIAGCSAWMQRDLLHRCRNNRSPLEEVQATDC